MIGLMRCGCDTVVFVVLEVGVWVLALTFEFVCFVGCACSGLRT